MVSLILCSIQPLFINLHRLPDIPALWHSRIIFYSDHQQNASRESSEILADTNDVVTQPSKFGTYIYSSDHEKHAKLPKKLICYYTTPRYESKRKLGESTLKIKDINPHLCTHLNIGIIDISNCSLVLDDDLRNAFKASNLLKARNENLKVMLWVGGADETTGFSEMVADHANRKRFIQSLKATLEEYTLDGVGKLQIVSLSIVILMQIFVCRFGLGIPERLKCTADSLHATAAWNKTRVSARTQHVPFVVGGCSADNVHRNVLRRSNDKRERRLRECDDLWLPFLLEGNAVYW